MGNTIKTPLGAIAVNSNSQLAERLFSNFTRRCNHKIQ